MRVGKELSGELELLFGSPQGSILSPLLFIIYLVDVEKWVKFVNVTGYADDSGIYRAGKNMDILLEQLVTDATGILKFMASNKLVANPAKTEFIVCQPRGVQRNEQPFKVLVGGSEIVESKDIKLLGLTITNTLKWDTYLAKLERSLIQKHGLI